MAVHMVCECPHTQTPLLLAMGWKFQIKHYIPKYTVYE